MGGAYDDVPAHATAFAHRRRRFILKHTATVGLDAPAVDHAASARWLAGSFDATRQWGSGRVYPNFPDLSLSQPQHAYYAENLPRLSRIRHAYDPDRLLSPPSHRPVMITTPRRQPT